MKMRSEPMQLLAPASASETVASVASLSEAHRSVLVPRNARGWRQFAAVAGPGFMVSVGYMDPGNWGTDLAGGAKFGYRLLWVILGSSLMAMLLQTLCVRLGLATGKDLAQMCRDEYKKPACIALWLLCEVAIIACDLAEVIGSAVALNLLTGLPLVAGVLVTGFDVLLLLGLTKLGFRKLEAVVITLVATIAGCFLLEIVMAHPDWRGVLQGTFVPSLPSRDALYVSLAILGATVMPHNLYLHSSLVQTRDHDRSPNGIRQAIRFNTLDTLIALGAAFFVNAAILVVAAAVFHNRGLMNVEDLGEAHRLLTPLLGGAAATAFALALLASGQSSTITGTLAGQIVMEGFVHLRVAPWLRRLITRSLAIIPAVVIIGASGGKNTVGLLVFSQVILSMQLSFATFPLLMFTSDPRKMGAFVNALWLKAAGYFVCIVIAALNFYLLGQTAYDHFKIGGIAALAAITLGVIVFSLWVKYGYRESARSIP